jgi:hypothetical protein
VPASRAALSVRHWLLGLLRRKIIGICHALREAKSGWPGNYFCGRGAVVLTGKWPGCSRAACLRCFSAGFHAPVEACCRFEFRGVRRVKTGLWFRLEGRFFGQSARRLAGCGSPGRLAIAGVSVVGCGFPGRFVAMLTGAVFAGRRGGNRARVGLVSAFGTNKPLQRERLSGVSLKIGG